jgi:hypothetical protein
MKRAAASNARGREAPMVITPRAVGRLVKQIVSVIKARPKRD